MCFLSFASVAPSCETCSQFIEGGCKCEELEEHAASFLAPGEDMEEAGEELVDPQPISSSLSNKPPEQPPLNE